MAAMDTKPGAEAPRDIVRPAIDTLGTETANWQFVGSQAGAVVVLAPRSRMTPDEALLHAAWLVFVADVELSLNGNSDDLYPTALQRFTQVLAAVQAT